MRRLVRQRTEFAQLGLARLEDRVVLDAAAAVADLKPGPTSSNPSELTQFNGSYYFTADGTNAAGQSIGRELFKLNADGSVTLVADINSGTAGSDPSGFTLFDPNGSARMLFAATGPQGRELYQIDTSGNVTLLFDVNSGTGSSDPVMLVEFSGKLYFTAFTPTTGREAYVVNNGGNVSLIADLNPGTASSNPSALYFFGGSLYFSAEVGGTRQLLREAPSGTSDPVQVSLGAGVSDPRDFVTFGDKLYFSALDPTDGRELFAMSVSNSGKETVVKVANLNGTSASSSPGNFFVFNQNLYFAATTANGRELFRLDAAGNITQLDLAQGPASSSPSGFVAFNNELYFAATVSGTRGLWRLDTSTPALAAVPVPLPTGVSLPQEAVFYALGSELYFAADGAAGRELYRMNTARVVTLAADVNPGPAGSDPAEVILFGGKVYFVATEASVGRELFVLRRDPSSVRIEDGKLIFNDDAGDKDNRLVVSSTGTLLVIVDQNGHTISILTAIAGATGAGTNQVTIPLASLAGISTLDIFTRGGNDSVTFDLSANANSILGQFDASHYDGGTNSAAGDKLRFVGDGITSSAYTPDAATTGSGAVVVSSPTQSLAFSFLALEPVDFTGMAEARLVTPASPTGADALTLATGVDSLNGLLPALIVSGTVGGTTIESAYFFGNQSVVIVTSSGVDGTDSVVVSGAANAHGNANFSIDTGPLGSDTVSVNGNVTLSGGMQINTAALSVQSTITLGGAAAFNTRSDTTFSTSGKLLSPQVTIQAGGAINLADGALIDAGAGTIALTATGNITLGRLVTTNNTAAAIAVTSLTGSVIDGGDSGGPNIVAEGTNALVSIQAAQAVGSASSPLDLAVRNLVVTSGGDQRLNELDDLSSLNLNAGAATIYLTAGGQVQDADAAVDIVAGQLVLTATKGGIIAQPLQTQIGALVANLSAGDLHLTESDGLTVVAVAAPAGNVNLRSLTGNLTVQSLQAQGLVTLVAGSGAILSGGAGPNVAAANLEMQAASGIGTSAAALTTQVQKLEASGGTGGVFVANTGNLQVGGISPSLLSLTGLSASGSPVVLTVAGTLTVVESVTVTGAGNIDFSATSDLIVQAPITGATGAIDLEALRALRVEGTSISSSSGPITLSGNLGGAAAGAFSGITLSSATIASASGNITLQGQGGAGGNGLLLTGSSVGQTGSGNILLAGAGTLGQADIAWDTLTLAKSGGVYTFQDTVQGGQLIVQPGAYQVRFLDGGTITQSVNFQNTGGVVLGNANSDSLTFAGGLTSVSGATTIQGTVITQGTDILLGATTLVGAVSLLTGGGNVTAGQVQGAGVQLTINAVTGDVTLANPANVIGNLTITADQVTIFENDDITQGGAWATTGLTTLNSGAHNIVLTNPANQFGPLQLTGASLSLAETGGTELAAVSWNGALDVSATGNLLVSGLISGSGSAQLAATGNVTFTATSSLVSPSAANVSINGGAQISLADGTRIDAGAGTIALLASGNITLGRLVTTNNTAAAISITSQTGGVIDGGDSGGPNIVAEGLAAVVSIQAAQGVGAVASPLDLAVRNLVVTSGGDQYLNELDDLSSLNLNAGSASIHLTAGGQVQDNDAALDIQAASLTLTAQAAGTSASLQTKIGSLTAAALAGDLYLQEADGLTVVSATALAAGGDIGIRTLAGNLVIQSIQASGLVTLVADAGAIQKGAAGTNVTAANLEMQAAAGIGTSAMPLALQVQRLEASGGTGGLFVANSGNLQVGGISPSLLNLTGLSTASSNLVLTAIGTLTVVEGITATGAGNINLAATSDLVVQAPVASQAGAIDLTAQRALSVQSTSISSSSGPITLLANQNALPAAGSFSGITLTSATIASASGNITLQGQGGAGGGNGLLLLGSSFGQTGSGNVLLAGIGTLGQADIAWDSLTLAKSGGIYTFQDTVQGGQLIVQPGPYQVRFLDGGTITQAVNFQNTGGVILGNANSDSITFAGGLNSVSGPTTIQGTVSTQGTDILLGATTLVGAVSLLTSGGNVTAGQIQGAGVPLVINAGSGDVTLANPANVIGNLTITADQVTIFENDNITQGGAWTTTGLTTLNSGSFAIVLTNPANQFGPLNLTGGSINVVEAGGTELAGLVWNGVLAVNAAGDLLVSGSITGSGTAQLAASGNITFSPGGSLVATGGSANVALQAGGAISLADGALIDAGAGTIALTATGNITLGRLVTTNLTGAAVTITSLTGSVIDGSDSGGPNIVAEGLSAIVTIQAALGVGSAASPLDLAVRNLVVASGGNQYLNELDYLSSLNLNAGSAAIQLMAGGQIQDSDAEIDIQAASLALTAQAAGTAAAPLQTQIGTLTAAALAGDFYLQEADGLTVVSVTALAAGGDVGIRSLTGNVVVESIQASGLVTLVADQGAIVKGAAGTNVTAANLEMQAASGIGTAAAPLLTQVQRLEGSGGTGGLFVANSGNLQIGGIIPSLLNLTGLSASGSPIALAVTGTLTTVEAISTTGSGNIDLSATSDLVVQAPITSAAGAITLTAQRALRVENASVSGDSGAIALTANQSGAGAGAFSGITLSGASVGSASGNITLQGQGGAGGGNGLLLLGSSVGQTGSGNVLLAGVGTLGQADIAWDTLTLNKSGGIYTFQDTVQGGQLIVLPGPYQVRFLDGGVITQPVNFQNTGGVLLGNQDADSITFAGGLTSLAGPTTIQGTVITQGTGISLGATTLVSTSPANPVTLLTSGGNVTIGPIQGAGVPLVIHAGVGDVALANPANVIGNLTITADQVTIFENDNVTQGGAWTTTGLTTLSSGTHNIVLTNPANQFGPLKLTGGNISIVETGGTELAAAAWSGQLNIDAAGNLLVSGLLSGNSSAHLTADQDITFSPGGKILAAGGSVNVVLEAAGAIGLADGSLIDAGAGTIALMASGQITLGRLITTNNTGSAISITSQTASVNDGGDSGGANIVAEGASAVVTIQAAQGVGSAASPLDVAVKNLVVTSGGNQYLDELDGLSSLNLNAGGAAIFLTAGGQIQDADAALDIQAAGLALVALGAGASGQPLQVAVANFEAEIGSGGLFVSDTGGLELGGVSAGIKGVHANGPLQIATTGSILVSGEVGTTGSGAAALTASGDITLAALIQSRAGNITLSATGDILATASGGMATGQGTMLLIADSDNAGGGTIQFAGNIDVGDGQVNFRFPDADGLMSGVISGQGGLVKQGPGTLTIPASSRNTYTGTTELMGGTLRVDGAIGAAGHAGTFTLAGGTTLTGGGDVNAPIFASDTTARIVSLGNLALGDDSTGGFNFAGTLLVAGNHVTLRDADAAQLGVLTMISGGGHLTAMHGVEVGRNERLAGSGAVTGKITVLSGGQISPGASPGVVTTTTPGDIELQSGATYVVEINGSAIGQYDQLQVQGTVNVSGAVLSLSSTIRPTIGTVFTLIENDDGGDGISGEFAGLADGATVRFGAIEATISYHGGSGNNDVTLTVTDQLKIVRTNTPDGIVRVSRETGGGGGTSILQRVVAAPVIFTDSARAVAASQGTDTRPAALESRAVARLRVFLKVVDEVTLKEEGEPANLDPRVLDDVLGFFQRYKFPNGRYRIYVQEVGQSPRLIIEIAIRDGRAVTPEPQAQPANPVPAAPAPPAPAGQPAGDVDPAPADAASLPAPAASSDQPAVALSQEEEEPAIPKGSWGRWSAASASVAAGLALAAAQPDWRRRMSRLLARRDQLPRTRFRLRRGSALKQQDGFAKP